MISLKVIIMDKLMKTFVPINIVSILVCAIIYNFTELSDVYAWLPLPLGFLISLILTLDKEKFRILRFFVWVWLLVFIMSPIVLAFS